MGKKKSYDKGKGKNKGYGNKGKLIEVGDATDEDWWWQDDSSGWNEATWYDGYTSQVSWADQEWYGASWRNWDVNVSEVQKQGQSTTPVAGSKGNPSFVRCFWSFPFLSLCSVLASFVVSCVVRGPSFCVLFSSFPSFLCVLFSPLSFQGVLFSPVVLLCCSCLCRPSFVCYFCLFGLSLVWCFRLWSFLRVVLASVVLPSVLFSPLFVVLPSCAVASFDVSWWNQDGSCSSIGSQ